MNLLGAGDGRPLQVQAVAELADLVGHEANVRIEMFLVDQVRRLGGDLFDLDAAFAGHHENRFGSGAVENDAQVELAGDFCSLLRRRCG